jgi:porphobilinogen synthase
MDFPCYRPRRLRANENLRRLIRETTLTINDLIYPLFVRPGKGVKNPIGSMPNCCQFSIDELIKEAREVKKLGIPASSSSGYLKKKTRWLQRPMPQTALCKRPSRLSKTLSLTY